MLIKIKKLRPDAVIPTCGSDKSAGYDLYACEDVEIMIPPHTTTLIHTGLSIQPPEGYYFAIVARSGLATKQGLRPANCYGVCDEDYRGEYMVALHNDTDASRVIKPGERVAQLLLMQYYKCDFEEVSELDDTARGEGGFGSTGR